MTAILTMAFAFGTAVYVFDDKYLLVGMVLLFYVLVDRLWRWHRQQKLFSQAVISQNGVTLKLKTFLDSGNSLVDPQSGLPVSIISLPVFLQMFPQATADQILLHELDQVLPGGRYINYRTISGTDQLFVFAPERLQVNGAVVTQSLLGVPARDFGNAKYDALLNVKLRGLL